MNRGAAVRQPMDAMELVAIGGFSFFFAWMLLSFYWLPVSLFAGMPVAQRDFMQLPIFVGISIGYLGLHFLGKTKLRLRQPQANIIEAVVGLLLPVVATVHVLGVHVPLAVFVVVGFLTGVGGAGLTVRWLDVSGRAKAASIERFAPMSLVGGGLLFAIASLLPSLTQPLFAALYVLASTGLLFFVCARGGIFSSPSEQETGEGEEAVPSGNPLKFSLEVEPSFVAFGIVFGFTFVYLCNYGPSSLLPALLCVIPGAGIIAVLVLLRVRLSITVLQRVLLCVTVLACVAVPFVPQLFQLVCCCLVVVAWAALMGTNYALLVRILVQAKAGELYRLVPLRLVPSAIGFALGWAIAAVLTYFSGGTHELFTIARLTMAIVLVFVVMLFMPERDHHMGGQPKPASQSEGLSESELLDRRCEAIAELYQLSPRETDILKYLARGRNAAHIQSKLTISPHTVKSHIYSIYRKLDIHSQQKVMDFVESFPLDGR